MVHVNNLYPVRPEVSNEDASQYFVNPCTGEGSYQHCCSEDTHDKLKCLVRLCCMFKYLGPCSITQQYVKQSGRSCKEQSFTP